MHHDSITAPQHIQLHRQCLSSPTSAPLNKAGDANVAVDRDSRGTPCPHLFMMSQLTDVKTLLMLLKCRCLGNKTKTKHLVQVVLCACPF